MSSWISSNWVGHKIGVGDLHTFTIATLHTLLDWLSIHWVDYIPWNSIHWWILVLSWMWYFSMALFMESMYHQIHNLNYTSVYHFHPVRDPASWIQCHHTNSLLQYESHSLSVVQTQVVTLGYHSSINSTNFYQVIFWVVSRSLHQWIQGSCLSFLDQDQPMITVDSSTLNL